MIILQPDIGMVRLLSGFSYEIYMHYLEYIRDEKSLVLSGDQLAHRRQSRRFAGNGCFVSRLKYSTQCGISTVAPIKTEAESRNTRHKTLNVVHVKIDGETQRSNGNSKLMLLFT